MPKTLVACLCLAVAAGASAANAEMILFESATLGPTGLVSGEVPATNVNGSVFTGVRFELEQPVRTSRIGGHFFGVGDFFGAIVALDSPDDFPDSGDLSTPDVLGVATLDFLQLSDEVFGELELELEAGSYALVFGSGLQGTTGDGAATRNNASVGNPINVGSQPGFIEQFFVLNPVFIDHRFVVTGTIVPEPHSLPIALTAILLSVFRRSSYQDE